MITHHEPLSVNVLTQNIMLDKKLTNAGRILPQKHRIGSIAATLANFHGSLDVVGIQEAYEENGEHYGRILASECGFESGYWSVHNQPQKELGRGRIGENIGMFGARVAEVKEIPLGDNRTALLIVIGGVAFVTCHLRAGIKRAARKDRCEQAEVLIDAIGQYDNAVLFGDMNEPDIPRFSRARSAFTDANFESALTKAGNRSIKTFPTNEYRQIRRVPKIRIDDILVRGDRITVRDASVLERVIIQHSHAVDVPGRVPQAPSDHDGLYAELEI